MGDLDDCPDCGDREKKEILSVFRQMWRRGDSPLHRIYSSWEDLEQNVKIETKEKEELSTQPCPNCGEKQTIKKPLEGFLPYQNCKLCKNAFYVNPDLTVRKLTAEEKEDMPTAWVQIIEDLSSKKCSIVFKLE